MVEISKINTGPLMRVTMASDRFEAFPANSDIFITNYPALIGGNFARKSAAVSCPRPAPAIALSTGVASATN